MEVLVGIGIGCVALVVIGLVAEALFQGVVIGVLDRFRAFLSRAADTESMTDSRVTCGLRAVSGRVYNMGTEWSTGTATLSAGRILFDPTMGIVGIRDIRVETLGPSMSTAREPEISILRLYTDRGELDWRLNTSIASLASTAVAHRDRA